MNKVAFGPNTFVLPHPVLLVGSNVDNKPDFMAVAWGGVACSDPPMLSVAIRPQRHTLKGIRQNNNFSVNIPGQNLVKEADYCGLVSGARDDKVKTCGFSIFYGKLANAPMIEQCPINMECKVVHMLNLGSHILVVGSIEETHITENCLTDGKPDIEKIRPMLFSSGGSSQYYACGQAIADAFSIGNKIKNSK
jgi:flavin reductase (DIM6/NTAB) family NADH-FMN oxidoreductase RutF